MQTSLVDPHDITTSPGAGLEQRVGQPSGGAEHAAEQPVPAEHRYGHPIPTTWTTPTPTIQREGFE